MVGGSGLLGEGPGMKRMMPGKSLIYKHLSKHTKSMLIDFDSILYHMRQQTMKQL
jgi:shikimate kinase